MNNDTIDAWEFDSALLHRLSYMWSRYNLGHKRALSDAVVECENHNLFRRSNLDNDLHTIVSKIDKARMSDKPKLRRGRQTAALDHVIRHSLVERQLEGEQGAPNKVSVRRAAAVVASRLAHVEAEAVRKSHTLVEEADGDIIGDSYISQHQDN